MKILHLGIEAWVAGPNNTLLFPFTLGDGKRDVVLYRMDGTLSFSQQAGLQDELQERQSLMQLYSPAMMAAPVNGAVGTPTVGKGENFEVDNALWCANVKREANIPIGVPFAQPMTVPKGALVLLVNCNAGSTPDTEVHLTFQFDEAA